MRNDTRQLFNAYLSGVASLNSVPVADVQSFVVAPSVQQTLETRVQESSDFLNRINISPVDEMKGEKLGLGVTSTIASRTDTTNADRVPVDPTDLTGLGYECKQTNFDTVLRYAKLDAWAKFPDFETRIRDAILRQQALDRIMIGFNGTTAAATTNRGANQLLQDVNVGWLEHIRQDKPAHVYDEVTGGKAAGKVTYGTDGDYANLDALVYDAVQSHLPSWAVGDTELVAILGRDLLHDKYFPVIAAAGDKATEQIARDVILSTKRVGGLGAATVPFVPPKSILVTRFDNLSIYYQDGKRRRSVIDNPKRDRIENYESSNEAYVVEDYDFALLIENIERKDAA